MPGAGLAGGVEGADGVVVFPAGGDVDVGVGVGGGVEFGQGLPGGKGIPPDSELVAYGAWHGVPTQLDGVFAGFGGQRRGGQCGVRGLAGRVVGD